MSTSGIDDRLVRAAVFEYVDDVTQSGLHPISWDALHSFSYNGERMPLASQQGIFKPRFLELPISIRTAPPGPEGQLPYPDEMGQDNFLRYKYRGTDPNHYENVWLKRVMELGVPLLYLGGIARGIYEAAGAVVVEANDVQLSFSVALMPIASVAVGSVVELPEAQRRYYMTTIRQRATQRVFRDRVLRAYRTRCAMCRLRHKELLDAAHIIPDRDGGEPVVSNGLSMCKIHHAAFDHNLIGIRPDLVAEVRSDLLNERDGPMLRHGIQGIHGATLLRPTRPEWRPSTAALEVRYERFRAAG